MLPGYGCPENSLPYLQLPRSLHAGVSCPDTFTELSDPDVPSPVLPHAARDRINVKAIKREPILLIQISSFLLCTL